jgi:hypothetical protein
MLSITVVAIQRRESCRCVKLLRNTLPDTKPRRPRTRETKPTRRDRCGIPTALNSRLNVH